MTRRHLSYLTSALLILAMIALLQPAARDRQQESATAGASTAPASRSVSDTQQVDSQDADSQEASRLPLLQVAPNLADLELVGASIANYDR